MPKLEIDVDEKKVDWGKTTPTISVSKMTNDELIKRLNASKQNNKDLAATIVGLTEKLDKAEATIKIMLGRWDKAYDKYRSDSETAHEAIMKADNEKRQEFIAEYHHLKKAIKA